MFYVPGPLLKQDPCWGAGPHPAIVAIRDNKDYIRALLYSYYPTITGWGGPPKIYRKLIFVFVSRCEQLRPCNRWLPEVPEPRYIL